MKKLLLAYDHSDGARQAIGDLLNAGLPLEVQARVICVADVWLPPANEVEGIAPEEVPASLRVHRESAFAEYEASRKTAQEGAARISEKFPSWKVEPIWKADSPGWAIVQESTRWGADLVVVGAQGHSTLHRLFLGSVASKVVAEAHCSVRVARPHHKEGSELRILLAVDGSSDSTNAIAEVANRSWPQGARFQVVTVIDPKLKSFAARPGRFPGEEIKGEDRITLATNLQAEQLRAKALDVEVHVFDGDPKKRLLDQASSWKADCIFLGARGLTHGDRLYLGTLASAVAARAHCSVEIVRAK